jgi:hypothetical protein
MAGKTKKATPGMERPLTIACHMKIFDQAYLVPANWVDINLTISPV